MNDSSSNLLLLPDGAEICAIEAPSFHRVLDCLETAFPDVPRGFFHAIALNDPNYDPQFSLAVEKDGRVLSFIHLFDRTMLINGEAVRFGGVGSVGTRPECRGRGYAQALLNYAIHLMERRQMQGSILFTQIHRFYEQLGWKSVPQVEYEIPIGSLMEQSKGDYHFRPMRESDRQAIEAIYQQRLGTLQQGCLRTSAYFKARSSWMDHPGVVILSDRDEIVAYYWCSQYDPKKPLLGISEYGCRDGEDRGLSALLHAMGRKARDMKCDRVRGPFQQDNGFFDFIQSHNIKRNPWTNDYLMWRDINQSGVYKKIVQAAEHGKFLFWPTDAF